MNRFFSKITDTKRIKKYILKSRLWYLLPDEIYLRIVYKVYTGKKLNLNNPKTFNEKLQWLKLNDRDQRYTKLVDKYAVRQYVKEVIGEEYLIDLFGVWNKFEDIDFRKLPNKFVLKTTHDSGGVVICKDKKNFDINIEKRKIKKSLKRNYYYLWREWPYKDVKPMIICEKLLLDKDNKIPKDYKFFCFNGKVKLIQVDIDRYGNHMQNFYDDNWNFRNVRIHCNNNKDFKIDKPENLDEMINICEKLSNGFHHLRVDLYTIDNKIYFGELTFFHMSGLCKFISEELNYEMGEYIKI